MTIVKSLVFLVVCAGVTSTYALPAKVRKGAGASEPRQGAAVPTSSVDTTMARIDGPPPVPSMFTPGAPRHTIMRERKTADRAIHHPAPPAQVLRGGPVPTSSGDSTMARMEGPPPVPSSLSPEAPRMTVMRERRLVHNTFTRLQRDDFAEGLSGEPARAHHHGGFKTPSPRDPSTPPISGLSSERGSPAHVRHAAQSSQQTEHPASPSLDSIRAGKRPAPAQMSETASASNKKQMQRSSPSIISLPSAPVGDGFGIIDSKLSTHFENVDDYLKHLNDVHKTTKDPRWIEEHQKLIPRPRHDKPSYKYWGGHDWENQEHEQDEETLRHRNNWEAKNKAMQHIASLHHGVVRDPLGNLMVNNRLKLETAHKREKEGLIPKLIVKYPKGDPLKPVMHLEESDDHLALKETLKERMRQYQVEHEARQAAKQAAFEAERAAFEAERAAQASRDGGASSSGVGLDQTGAGTSKPASPSSSPSPHQQHGHHHSPAE
jgi:hypothetical protein